MKRRTLIKTGIQTGLAAGLTGAIPMNNIARAATTADAPHYYELRSYETRNDLQPQRLNDFMQQHLLPALKRADAQAIGVFQGAAGFARPGLLLTIDYKSLAAMQTAHEALEQDKAYQQALHELEGGLGLPYVRYETTLLRAFAGHTKMELPAALPAKDGKAQTRLFELRTYESRTTVSLKNKIEMFNQEEINIFRACDFTPIFFGETIVGTRMPSLTYLVGFDNMEQHDKAWAKFIASPDFNRIKVKPGWTDPEAVSTIHASYLRPTGYSQIK